LAFVFEVNGSDREDVSDLEQLSKAASQQAMDRTWSNVGTCPSKDDDADDRHGAENACREDTPHANE